MRTLKPSEQDIKKQITDWLTISRIFWYRQNVAGVKYGKHFVKFGKKGMADLIVIVKGRYVAIEVKKPGEKQSKEQQDFEGEVFNAMGVYILAHSLADVVQAINELY